MAGNFRRSSFVNSYRAFFLYSRSGTPDLDEIEAASGIG